MRRDGVERLVTTLRRRRDVAQRPLVDGVADADGDGVDVGVLYRRRLRPDLTRVGRRTVVCA